MLERQRPRMMLWSSFLLIITALINIPIVSTETKFARSKANLFSPILSANAYTGHIKENERIVQLEPRLHATDPDPANTLNGKICGYDLSLHKHDDILDEITVNIPFTLEMIDNQPILKLKSNFDTLDCEIKQTYRLFIRAFDCAPMDKRRYSERSSLIITVDDVNEYAPVFTHDNYLFKLHQDQTCNASSCRVEATDDDCANPDHRVCGYEIITPNVPFTIDSNGVISITKSLDNPQYQFDIIAIDCNPSSDATKKISQPARVTFKIIPTCKPLITDNTPEELSIQSDNTYLFDKVNVNTCDETCNVQDIVGKIELHTNGLDSGCNSEQCATTNHEYNFLPKGDDVNEVPPSKITPFNGLDQAIIVNQSEFSGHFNNEFTIRMSMKHSSDDQQNGKEHIFCKSDEKLKNRHHTALFIQNGYIKLLIRKGPTSSTAKTMYASEWSWKVSEINDNRWHVYEFNVNYPDKIEFYIDEQLIKTNEDNFRIINDYPLPVIQGTDDTIFTLGACWHARASRMVQHFHGELSGLAIEQKEELSRSSSCIRDCHQYIDISDMEPETGVEFTSNSNRSMWILRTDATDSYEKLLKHLVYRNTFQPMGPYGQRTITIQTQVKCLGETNTYELPTFTRSISIDEAKLPIQIELKSDTNYLVPEMAMNTGIYLFRNLSIYTNAMKNDQADIRDCLLTAKPTLSNTEFFILPDNINQDKQLTKDSVMITGVGSIDAYQYLLRQIAYVSKFPVTYVDRAFTLSCTGVYDQVSTNEIAVRIRIEKKIPAQVSGAAVLVDQLYVDNDQIRDNTFNIDDRTSRVKRNSSSWPIAVGICICIGLGGVLVLYLIVRVRSNHRQRNPTTNTGDDLHSQMEWEDDIGLNITINPLDETKKPVQSINIHNIEHTMNGSSSSDDDDDENDGRNHNEYSSEEDADYENKQKHPRKIDHQLEWDDAAIEYGPKKV